MRTQRPRGGPIPKRSIVIVAPALAGPVAARAARAADPDARIVPPERAETLNPLSTTLAQVVSGEAEAARVRLSGETRTFPVLRAPPVTGSLRGNPVFDDEGLKATLWDFDHAAMSSLNLFADGTLGTRYLLTETATPA